MFRGAATWKADWKAMILVDTSVWIDHLRSSNGHLGALLDGGIGMTWEYPAHLYLKRAKSDQLALGSAYRHRARIAELVDLPPS